MKENKSPSSTLSKENPKSLIENFLSHTEKLSLIKETGQESGRITLFQNYDKKKLSFKESEIEKVLERKDYNGEAFLQVNFKNGKKILLTNEFVGFPPALCPSMGQEKLPKVVTTADLLSVIEAIESSLYGTDQYQESLYDVKLFFEAIASGAESVGFSLTGERLWMEKLFPKHSASGF